MYLAASLASCLVLLLRTGGQYRPGLKFDELLVNLFEICQIEYL